MKFLYFLAFSSLFVLSSAAYAEEEKSLEKGSRTHIEAKHHKEGNLYIVGKGLLTLGDNFTEEAKGTEPEAKLSGNTGGGIGIDVGYRMGYGFAAELDFSYAQTRVKKSVVGEEDITADADYYSYGLDLLYGYHINEEYVIFGKIGWEIEQEEISDYDISGTNNGFAYAVGFEYAFTEHWAFVGEYEGSLIEGPHGPSIFAGASYTF
ncbi:porin family protein [Sulfurimonas sp.]|uniref:porin family protein n=1 Tax=Sulfurimonas sp. TaxID=2022749 RepID=UPI002606615F|nr:porin family protein [Sulfurimonas sp.]